MKYRLYRCFSILLLLLMLLSATGFANSAQTWWNGVDGNGAVVLEDESPIVVEREELVFDIQTLPGVYTDDAYTGSVTATYHFYNPADYTVTSKLYFPFGMLPDYASGYHDPSSGEYVYEDDSQQYEILVNGEYVEKQVRHSFQRDVYYFDLQKDIKEIQDDFVTDEFYGPDLEVTKYVYTLRGLDPNYDHGEAVVTMPDPGDEMRVMFSGINGMQHTDEGGYRFSAWVFNGESIAVYAIGGMLDPLSWSVHENGLEDAPEIGGKVELTETETMTFKDLAMEGWSEDSGVLEHDWYNASISALKASEFGEGFVSLDEMGYFDRLSTYLMRWYEYEITLGPGERMLNEVTAPIYPDIDGQWKPEKYEFTYLLSPASTWKEFGPIDVTVQTPFAMIDTPYEDFQQLEFGYVLHLDGLPEGEMVFTLCESTMPKRTGPAFSPYLVIILVPALLVVLTIWVIVAMVKKLSKRYMP